MLEKRKKKKKKRIIYIKGKKPWGGPRASIKIFFSKKREMNMQTMTMYVNARHFKSKFAFLDEFYFDKDTWRLRWPSYTGPIRLFPEETVYKVRAQLVDKKLWVFKAEKTIVKLKRLTISCETSSILWSIAAAIKNQVLKLEELIVAGAVSEISKLEKLGLPCKVIVAS